MGSISREKFVAKGSPLVPSDFSLAKEAVEISARFKDIYIWLSLIVLGIIVLIVLILKFTPHENYKWRNKAAIFLIAVAMVTAFYTKFGAIQETFSLELINLSQRMNYDENGMMLGFLLNAEYLKVQVPADYQESTIQQIIDTTKKTYSTDPNFKPNIIFVMSEAFWDPTLLKNVSFNKDPIPFFHSLQKSQTNGIMLSPVYGGGTANTEFEALTGFSTQYLPSGSIPYAQYVNKPIEALPTILQRQGYATSAIHTYDNWFYNRNNVYKELGFDKFFSKEFFNDPEYKGQYIRDTELSQKILDEVKETNQPDFIYAVSMQNHGPYSDLENPQNTVQCTDSNLSAASKALLDNYSNSVADVDQSIKLLIDGLKQINQPTVVIFYGDHLPMLGDDYSVYKEAGFINGDNSYQDYLNLHSVPFVTWNNFTTAKPTQNLRLSANFMGTYALQLAQKSGSPMTDFLSGLMQNGSDVVLPSEYSGQEKITPNEANQYQQLQYDLLFGKEYAYQSGENQKPPANTGYIQGDGKVTITNAAAANDALEISGENFVENDKVYIDGKLIKSTFKDSNGLSVSLEDLSKYKYPLKIQIELSDSMNKIISQSNVYQLSKK
ncbi:LTA synthase family protein [Desulfosporosinus sp. PR]|uniref:LTA synthase family protein n=1 Tax=Candidatus Desulfosporosinus nitrosoreducens TaxID=3401928 RepID=UPI0027FF854B|nr:LTA synthase family protein [Desulfosporosinus sp. PR]MDQ7093307.1 LTA synthase family protein [Desulfosporosinus sp. PR]